MRAESRRRVPRRLLFIAHGFSMRTDIVFRDDGVKQSQPAQADAELSGGIQGGIRRRQQPGFFRGGQWGMGPCRFHACGEWPAPKILVSRPESGERGFECRFKWSFHIGKKRKPANSSLKPAN